MRRQRGVRIAALAALVVLGVGVAFLATRPVGQGASSVDSPLVGTAAPNVRTVSLDAKPFSLAAQRGHTVVLSFFATWCGPCRSEQPELVTFQYDQSRRPHGARLFAVVFNDSISAARAYSRENGVTYPVLIDPSGRIANDFDVTGPPVSVVIAPDGRISDVLDGAVTASQLDRLVSGS